MQINFNAVALLVIAMPLVAAAPSEANVDASLAKRQRQYQCETSNDLGACNNAITKLRGHEARGCDVWCKFWLPKVLTVILTKVLP